MGTGNRQHPLVPQHVLRQPLRARDIVKAGIEHVLHCRIAAGHGIAHHHDVRRGLQVLGGIALGQDNTRCLQLGTHGWIDIGIGAGDPVAELSGQQGDTPHEGAANAEDMYVPFQVPLPLAKAASLARGSRNPQ